MKRGQMHDSRTGEGTDISRAFEKIEAQLDDYIVFVSKDF